MARVCIRSLTVYRHKFRLHAGPTVLLESRCISSAWAVTLDSQEQTRSARWWWYRPSAPSGSMILLSCRRRYFPNSSQSYVFNYNTCHETILSSQKHINKMQGSNWLCCNLYLVLCVYPALRGHLYTQDVVWRMKEKILWLSYSWQKKVM